MTKALIAGLAVATALTGAAGAAEFDLDALIAAAKSEPPLQVYDSTGKITEMAEAFAAKYGLQATGTKTKATAQLETIIREVQSGNVQTDVSFISDVPAAIGQLVPRGLAESWVPPDLAGDIDAAAKDPLLIVSSPAIIRKAVDLPQPDGPTSTRNSLSAIVRSRSWMAWKPLS